MAGLQMSSITSTSTSTSHIFAVPDIHSSHTSSGEYIDSWIVSSQCRVNIFTLFLLFMTFVHACSMKVKLERNDCNGYCALWGFSWAHSLSLWADIPAVVLSVSPYASILQIITNYCKPLREPLQYLIFNECICSPHHKAPTEQRKY